MVGEGRCLEYGCVCRFMVVFSIDTVISYSLSSTELSTISSTVKFLDKPIPVIFLLLMVGIWAAYAGTPFMDSLSVSFGAILLETMPFLVIGALVSGIMEVMVKAEWLERIFPKKSLIAPFIAGGMGLVFPVCECAIIPVARRLIGKGVPFTTVLAYLLAGPIVNPIVAASTLVAYNYSWSVTGLRIGCGYLIAVGVAFLMQRFYPGNSALLDSFRQASGHQKEEASAGHDDHGHGEKGSVSILQKILSIGSHAAHDFMQIGQYLIYGAFLAALLQTLVPREYFLQWGESGWSAILVMMVLAVALNLCSEADAFVAASFRFALPVSSQLAFMILGPMLDLKLVALYLTFVKKRPVALLVALLVVLVFGVCFLIHETLILL